MFSLLSCSPIGKGWGKPISCSLSLSLFLYGSLTRSNAHHISLHVPHTSPTLIIIAPSLFTFFCTAGGSILHRRVWWRCLMNQPWIRRKRGDLQWINIVVTCVSTNPLPWLYTINLDAIILTTMFLPENHDLICEVENATCLVETHFMS